MSAVTPRWGRVYPLACALAVMALSPYLVLATSSQFLMTTLESGLHTGPLGLSVVEGAADTGFAVGALVSADLAQRYESRRLFLSYSAAFVIGAVVAGCAPDIWVFFIGRLFMGAAAGLLLIGALPQLIRRYDADRLPATGLVVNFGLFSATVIGPTIGGFVAQTGAWRTLFFILAGIVTVALVVGVPGFESVEGERPGLDVDRWAFLLAVTGSALPFLGTALLVRADLPRWYVTASVLVGAGLLAGLLVFERRRERRGGREPSDQHPDVLIPASLLTTSVPVVGTLVAAVGGLVVSALLALTEVFLQQVSRQDPGHGAVLLLPILPGLIIAVAVYRLVFTTRWVFALIAAGFVALAAGGVTLYVTSATDPNIPAPIAAALLGFGAGATVSPGLFVASLGVPSGQLARTFAAVELLRNEFTFALVPVLVAIAGGSQPDLSSVRLAILGTLGITVLGAVVILLVAAAAGLPAGTPRLQTWLDEEGLGLDSPPIRCDRVSR